MRYVIAAFIMFFLLPLIHVALATSAVIIDNNKDFIFLLKDDALLVATVLLWAVCSFFVVETLIALDDRDEMF
jgi:hypothetical protein